jgi:hypothetical protein
VLEAPAYQFCCKIASGLAPPVSAAAVPALAGTVSVAGAVAKVHPAYGAEAAKTGLCELQPAQLWALHYVPGLLAYWLQGTSGLA